MRLYPCVLRRSTRRKSITQSGLRLPRLFSRFALSTQGCVRSQQRDNFLLADLFFKKHKPVVKVEIKRQALAE